MWLLAEAELTVAEEPKIKFFAPIDMSPFVRVKFPVSVKSSFSVIPPEPFKINLFTFPENIPEGIVKALEFANSISADAAEASILPPENEIVPSVYVNLLFNVVLLANVSVPEGLLTNKKGKLSFLEIV